MEQIIKFDYTNEILSDEKILSQFHDYLIRNENTPATIKSYLSCIKQFLEFLVIDLKQIDQMHIIHYKSELMDKQKLQAVTVNKKLQAIKRFSSWLCETGYIKNNVARDVKIIKIQSSNTAPKSLTEKEVNLLLQFAGTSKPSVKLRNYVMLQLLLNSGVRLSELVALNYGDVVINERSGSLLIRNGKGVKQRTISLNSKARNALESYFNYRIEKYGRHIADDEAVICTQNNKRMSSRAVQYTIEQLAKKSKISRLKISPHVMRHTFATNYYQATKDVAGVTALCGHSSFNTTKRYTLPTEDQLLIGLDKI